MVEKPRRTIEINIRLGADDWGAVRGFLNSVGYDLAKDGELRNCVSGGYSSGWTIEVSHDPSITHDGWAKALNEYLDAERGDHLTPEADNG